MKTENLRIGNLVLQHGKVSRIWKLDDSGVIYDKINGIPIKKRTGLTYKGEQPFKPIILKESWLKMLGFKHYIGHSYAIGDFHYSLLDKTICGIVSLSFKPKIENVHDLQNLYRFMTGTELEYKP